MKLEKKLLVMSLFVLSILTFINAGFSQPTVKSPGAGMLFFSKYTHQHNYDAISNPYIIGAFYPIYWSKIEQQKGVYDWSDLDDWIKHWTDAGKKVALRVMWSSSGYWVDPAAKTPTPQWVWDEGAKMALHDTSGTEVPLIWDPIYQEHALNFLDQVASRYDSSEHVLFFDVTPGAETNPYRFGTIDERDPAFQDTFIKTPASDGRTYSDALWLQTVKDFIDSSIVRFHSTPCLVTLNRGTLPDSPTNFFDIGNHSVSRDCFVGQNGLKGSSYESDGDWKSAFLSWSGHTNLFFEMVAKTGTDRIDGTIMEVMQAAERIKCSYLNVYPEDVLKGTQGYWGFDQSYEDALKYGAEYFESLITDIKENPLLKPTDYRLAQNYPNPFNPFTTIEFSLPDNSHVTLTVYNLLGKKIVTLIDDNLQPGNHSIKFHGKDLASGVYVYQLKAGSFNETKKALLLK